VDTRGGRDINRWDVAGVVLMGVGAVWSLIGLLLGETPGGFGIFVIGFLVLVRHHPGGA
jgi:hypothetical protein